MTDVYGKTFQLPQRTNQSLQLHRGYLICQKLLSKLLI